MGRLQPSLFLVRGVYYLKTDNTAIPLPSASCFVEAVEVTFMSFWVFGVEYPDSLRSVYKFSECVVGIKKQGMGAALRELFRELEKV